MNRYILSVILLLLPALCNAQAMAKLTAKTLLFGDQLCSGTAIGRSAILTATHCLRGLTQTVEVDGQTLQIVETLEVGTDQTIIRVNATFRHWARFGGKPFQGQRVHYIGNPGMVKLYRAGDVAAIADGMVILDSNAYMGDSGSGVFNGDGELVATVSGLLTHDTFKLTACRPFTFSPEQLARALAW